jgi:DNA-binding MarR family transcriptional regulator
MAQRVLDDDELRAWRSFTDMHHLLERHLISQLQSESGLSGSDFEILVNLSEAPGGRMRAFELGRATLWEKSRLSHHLRRMEKRGLVRRDSGGSDARYPHIVITDAGRAAIESSAPANAARVRRLFIDVLGPERLAVFREAADDVIAAVETDRR